MNNSGFKYILIITFIILVSLKVEAQVNDTTSQDTVKESLKKSPAKASLFSAILPGAGQVYNRKIWKVPIVYGGIGSFSYLAYRNHQGFMVFKKALVKRQNGEKDQFSGNLNDEALKNEMDRYRRYRDLNLIGATLVYVLQIIDANVDASLSDFDVSDDLSFFISPENNYKSGNLTLGLKFNF